MVKPKSTPFDFQGLAQFADMAEHLVRVGRLRELQKSRQWSDADLARRCDRKPQQIAAWFSGSRKIGERLARALEEALELPRFYLDDRNSGGSSPKQGVSEGPSAYIVMSGHATKSVRPVPVLSWEHLATMLAVPADELPKRTSRLETFAVSSPLAKFVQMIDDSMSPTFLPGDHILFDPQEAPHAGDTVLIRLKSGEHFVRTFMPRSAHEFEAVANNANYLPIYSKDGAVVVAVMVEHRRYRRARA